MSMNLKTKFFGACVFVLPLLLTGCNNQEKIDNSKKLTVGKIQYNISKNISSTKVIKALGSPNIITRDKNGKMTWVYDKIKTYKTKTNSGALDFARLNNNDFVITGGIAAAGGAFATTGNPVALATAGALGFLTYFSSNNNYKIETQQKTLTLILDFDRSERLENFSYMYSSF